MVEIVETPRAVIDSFEIYAINSLNKKKLETNSKIENLKIGVSNFLWPYITYLNRKKDRVSIWSIWPGMPHTQKSNLKKVVNNRDFI